MDNRTVRDAYQAATQLARQPAGMQAALQSMRLQRDLEEGEDIETAREKLVRSILGVEDGQPVAGVSVEDEVVAELEEEVEEFLAEEADTDPDDVRPIDLEVFDADSLQVTGVGLRALIEAGAVDEEAAFGLLDKLADD